MIRLANRTRVRSARYARYLYPVLFILLDYVAILLEMYQFCPTLRGPESLSA